MKKPCRQRLGNILNQFNIYNMEAPKQQQFPVHTKYGWKFQENNLPKQKKKVDLFFVHPNILFLHSDSHSMYKENLRARTADNIRNKIRDKLKENSLQKVRFSDEEPKKRLQTCPSKNRKIKMINQRSATQCEKRSQIMHRNQNCAKPYKNFHMKRLDSYIQVESMFNGFRQTGSIKRKNQSYCSK